MDPVRVLDHHQGFVSRADVRELGYDDRAVAHAVRSGAWVRIRRGYYTFADVWQARDEDSRHLTRAGCVLHSLGPAVALSHVSGVLAHGIEVHGLDLTRVHVTRLDGGPGRIEGDVVHHEGLCLDDDVRTVRGRRVLVAERCVLEAGSRTSSRASRLILTDGLLRHGLADHDQLLARFTQMQHWPYMRAMHLAVRMADGRSASPGESFGRQTFRDLHLPAPELQFEVRGEDGELIGTSDWGWPEHGVLGEFDGRVKYGRMLRPGQSAGDVVFAEKQREDAMRMASGYAMFRVIWEDYQRTRLLKQRLEKLLQRAS